MGDPREKVGAAPAAHWALLFSVALSAAMAFAAVDIKIDLPRESDDWFSAVVERSKVNSFAQLNRMSSDDKQYARDMSSFIATAGGPPKRATHRQFGLDYSRHRSRLDMHEETTKWKSVIAKA